MEHTTIRNWDRTRAAWLWVETGNGQLLPVRSIGTDLWVRTGTGLGGMSWCCHADTRLWIGTPEEAKGQERVLQDDFAARRARWAAEERASLERLRKTIGGAA